VIKGSYLPSKKTTINFELAGSNNDLNLFSDRDDSNNEGVAVHIDINQQLFKPTKNWTSKINTGVDYIDAKFRNIEGLYNVEFNRDWNLDFNFQPNTQIFSQNKFEFSNAKKGTLAYGLEHLDFRDQYKGTRHLFSASLNQHKLYC